MTLRFLSILFFATVAIKANSQQLFFYFNDASVQMYSIAEVRRMNVDSANLTLHLIDESIVTFELTTLNYYRYFAEDVTNVAELNNRPSLTFYPNPAEQELNLQYSLPYATQNLSVTIHNLKGEKVLVKQLTSSKDGKVTLALNNLATGQYFCTLSAGDMVISKAFMKR